VPFQFCSDCGEERTHTEPNWKRIGPAYVCPDCQETRAEMGLLVMALHPDIHPCTQCGNPTRSEGKVCPNCLTQKEFEIEEEPRCGPQK